MDAILIIIIAIFMTRRAIKESTTNIIDLPVGKNPKGYYDTEAFTQVYLMRRGFKND